MYSAVRCIAKKELASTNQNLRIEWRRFAPPLDSWVLCPKQNLLCYNNQLLGEVVGVGVAAFGVATGVGVAVTVTAGAGATG